MDGARGADRGEQVGPSEHCVDALHVERHLTKPDHVRPERARGPTPGAGGATRHVAVPCHRLVTSRAQSGSSRRNRRRWPTACYG